MKTYPRHLPWAKIETVLSTIALITALIVLIFGILSLTGCDDNCSLLIAH